MLLREVVRNSRGWNLADGSGSPGHGNEDYTSSPSPSHTHTLLPANHRVKSLLSEAPAAGISSPSTYYQTAME